MDSVFDLLVAAVVAEQEGFRATCRALQNMATCSVCPLASRCDGSFCWVEAGMVRQLAVAAPGPARKFDR